MKEQVCRALPDCGRPVMARGLCQTHYNQDRRGESFRPVKSILVGGTRMTSIQVRVNYETRRALGLHPNKQARLVLEEWAKE